MEKFTKAQILEGKSGTEDMEILTLGCILEIRPLTDGEWARIEVREMTGIRTTIGDDESVTVEDSGLMKENEHKANLLCCQCGLVEQWSETELDSLPLGAVAEIADAIKDVSGVSKSEKAQAIAMAARSFRAEP